MNYTNDQFTANIWSWTFKWLACFLWGKIKKMKKWVVNVNLAASLACVSKCHGRLIQASLCSLAKAVRIIQHNTCMTQRCRARGGRKDAGRRVGVYACTAERVRRSEAASALNEKSIQKMVSGPQQCDWSQFHSLHHRGPGERSHRSVPPPPPDAWLHGTGTDDFILTGLAQTWF